MSVAAANTVSKILFLFILIVFRLMIFDFGCRQADNTYNYER